MYRKRNGSLGFSFTKFAHATVPNFFEDDARTRAAELGPLRKDMCYAHQITSDNPYGLDERSFYVAGITDNEAMSKKVFRALKKNDLLREDNTVDTMKVGPRFVHQMATINMVRQRELVNMLFWWEEETQRLKKLIDEEKELDGMIKESEKFVAENEDDVERKALLDQLKFARERVRMKRRQRPSQRREDVENDSDNLMDVFHGRSKSAPQIHPGPVDQPEERGLPPQYYG